MRWPRAESVFPKRDAKTRKAVRDALSILRAGVDAVDPQRVTEAAVAKDPRGWRLGTGADSTIVPRAARLHVLAVGKAAPAMARGFATQAAFASMLVVAPARSGRPPPGSDVVTGGHPLPSAASFRAGKRALDLARSMQPGDVLVVLASGGASSLLEHPAVPPGEYSRAMRTLVRSGLPIEDLNAVRKHLSNVKGGQLSLEAAARGVPVVGLALSDVPSDRLDTIGSGLTAPDPTTFRDALQAVERHAVAKTLPPAVARRLRDGARGLVPETPKAGALPFARVTNAIVASNRLALRTMESEARRLGHRAATLEEPLRGEAWLAGQEFARRLLRTRAARPFCLLAGGETTVRVRGPGRGGRNQEFALGAATVLSGKRAIVAAFGTDGLDGNSANAGAVVDGRTMAAAEAEGLDVERVFARSDSGTFFARVAGALRTGPTGTNVADVAVGIGW